MTLSNLLPRRLESLIEFPSDFASDYPRQYPDVSMTRPSTDRDEVLVIECVIWSSCELTKQRLKIKPATEYKCRVEFRETDEHETHRDPSWNLQWFLW